MFSRGTPQDLDDLAFQIMTTPCRDLQAQIPQMVQEYLAQKFQLTLGDNSAHQEMIERLYHTCVARKRKDTP